MQVVADRSRGSPLPAPDCACYNPGVAKKREKESGPKGAKKRDDDLPAELRVCDAIGGLVEFWGFSRHLGRIWTLLYLTPRPRSAGDVQRELSISAGAASAALRELLRWGVLRKVWVPGERKDWFEAETDLWKMVSRVFEEREKKLIDQARGALDRASADLDAEAKRGPAADRELAAFRRGRVDELRRLAQTAEVMLQLLVRTRRLDATGLDRDLGK